MISAKGLMRMRQVPVNRWLLVVAVGMLIFSLLFEVGYAMAQFIVHTLAYQLSDSYRAHVETFGGFGGYIETQLVPRVLHSITDAYGWFIKVITGGLMGLIMFIIFLYTNNSNMLRFLLLTTFIVAFIGWQESKAIIHTPIWGVIDIVLWLICFWVAKICYTRLSQHSVSEGRR